mmetsp:Transcript_11545/g.70968  ORF Transcript_11545/g.70968 Transcript_11545/m.70968 type:complete len:211 (+) Transcript_11545:187-819(+)
MLRGTTAGRRGVEGAGRRRRDDVRPSCHGRGGMDREDGQGGARSGAKRTRARPGLRFRLSAVGHDHGRTLDELSRACARASSGPHAPHRDHAKQHDVQALERRRNRTLGRMHVARRRPSTRCRAPGHFRHDACSDLDGWKSAPGVASASRDGRGRRQEATVAAGSRTDACGRSNAFRTRHERRRRRHQSFLGYGEKVLAWRRTRMDAERR